VSLCEHVLIDHLTNLSPRCRGDYCSIGSCSLKKSQRDADEQSSSRERCPTGDASAVV